MPEKLVHTIEKGSDLFIFYIHVPTIRIGPIKKESNQTKKIEIEEGQ